jgi:hypothetical protein
MAKMKFLFSINCTLKFSLVMNFVNQQSRRHTSGLISWLGRIDFPGVQEKGFKEYIREK